MIKKQKPQNKERKKLNALVKKDKKKNNVVEKLKLPINGALLSVVATTLSTPSWNTNTHHHIWKCRVSSVSSGLADQQIF